jgi:hypothetical protein
MPDPTTTAPGAPMLVEHYYRQLALDRAVQARTLLAGEPVERAFAECADAFERAAAALEHSATLAPPSGELAERLSDQVEALLCAAARFEQSADLARHVARRRPSR